MKKLIQTLALLFFAATILHAENEVNYTTILPKALKKFIAGSTLEDNKKNIPVTNSEESDIISFRKEFVINKPAKSIKELTLYFDNEGDRRLYEYIIEYSNVQARDAFTESVYGEPNQDGEWEWNMEDGYTARAWTFMNKLVIAFAFPGTEWENEWGIKVKP